MHPNMVRPLNNDIALLGIFSFFEKKRKNATGCAWVFAMWGRKRQKGNKQIGEMCKVCEIVAMCTATNCERTMCEGRK